MTELVTVGQLNSINGVFNKTSIKLKFKIKFKFKIYFVAIRLIGFVNVIRMQ